MLEDLHYAEDLHALAWESQGRTATGVPVSRDRSPIDRRAAKLFPTSRDCDRPERDSPLHCAKKHGGMENAIRWNMGQAAAAHLSPPLFWRAVVTDINYTPLHGIPPTPGIEERWDALRSKIRTTWPQLSQDDLISIDGDSRKLVALVHQKTGADLSEIEHQIDALASSSEGLLERVNRAAKWTLEAAAQNVGQPVSRAYDATQKQIVATPGRSVGIAFGIGALIGICTVSLMRDVCSPPSKRW